MSETNAMRQATVESTNDPRALEAQARALEKTDPEAARGLFAAAAASWKTRATAPFAASHYLSCARKGGADPCALLGEAEEMIGRFPKNAYIASTHGWICRDAARHAVESGSFDQAAHALEGAMAALAIDREPRMLALALLGVLRRFEEAASELREDRRGKALSRLAELLRACGLELAQHLPLEDDARDGRGGRGRERKPPLALLFYLGRKVADAVSDMAFMDGWMALAAEKFPRDEWFAEAWIRAAAGLGRVEDARVRGAAAFERLPESWSVAAARAEVEEKGGDLPAAVSMLEQACLQARSPWPWARLAGLLEKSGDCRAAAEALAAGLSFHRREEADKVWRLHHDLGRLSLELGEKEAAVRELWLGLESRRIGGWALAREQRKMFFDDPALEESVGALDREPEGSIRKAAGAAYRRGLDAFRRGRALTAAVKRVDPGNRFAFVKLDGGREAYVHGSLLARTRLVEGRRVLALVVESFDAKKGRRSWKVAWMEPVGDPRAPAG